jgi:hypothetical protein
VNVEARQARARVARAREAHEADRAPFAAQLEDVEDRLRAIEKPKAEASSAGVGLSFDFDEINEATR